MGNWEKTLEQVMSGETDANIGYGDLCVMLRRLGYESRQGGSSHNIFRKPGCDLINLQRTGGGYAKAYQIKQVREQLKKGKQ